MKQLDQEDALVSRAARAAAPTADAGQWSKLERAVRFAVRNGLID